MKQPCGLGMHPLKSKEKKLLQLDAVFLEVEHALRDLSIQMPELGKSRREATTIRCSYNHRCGLTLQERSQLQREALQREKAESMSLCLDLARGRLQTLCSEGAPAISDPHMSVELLGARMRLSG